MGFYEVIYSDDRALKWTRIAVRSWQKHVDHEASGKHRWLELQYAIDKPYDSQKNLHESSSRHLRDRDSVIANKASP
jgi:hypothetical protein